MINRREVLRKIKTYVTLHIQRYLIQIQNFPYSSLLNFNDWAERMTPQKLKWGFSPPLKTLFAIVFLSSVVTSFLSIWLGLGGSATHFSAGFLPLIGATIPTVSTLSLLTFWFCREIQFIILGAKEVREDSTVGYEIDLIQMVKHVTAEVYDHFEGLTPNADNEPKHIPIPLVCIYDSNVAEIKTCEGRNRGKSALFFSTMMLNAHHTKMTRRQLAALIQKEVFKIYMHTGVTRVSLGIGQALGATTSCLFADHWFYKFLYGVTFPLQLAFLINQAILRGFEREAGELVCMAAYRGYDFIKATEKQFFPGLKELKPYELQQSKLKRMRAPYKGHWLLESFFTWADNLELAGHDKTGHRLVALMDNLVREFGLLFKEFYGGMRGTTARRLFRHLIKNTETGKTLMEVTDSETQEIKQQERDNNRILYNKIALGCYKEYLYEPIGPDALDMPQHHHPDHADPFNNPQLAEMLKGLVMKMQDYEKTIGHLSRQVATLSEMNSPITPSAHRQFNFDSFVEKNKNTQRKAEEQIKEEEESGMPISGSSSNINYIRKRSASHNLPKFSPYY